MLVLGVGLGFTMQVLVLAVQNAVPYSQLGVATSSATLFRSIGGSLGTAILGAIFANRLADELAAKLPKGSPGAANLASGQIDPAQLKQLPAALHDSYVHSFTDSISTVFLIAAVVVAVAFGLAWLLEERPLRKTIEDSGVGDAFAAPQDTDSLGEITRELSRLVGRERTRRFIEGVSEEAGVGARAGRDLAAGQGPGRRDPARCTRGRGRRRPRAARIRARPSRRERAMRTGGRRPGPAHDRGPGDPAAAALRQGGQAADPCRRLGVGVAGARRCDRAALRRARARAGARVGGRRLSVASGRFRPSRHSRLPASPPISRRALPRARIWLTSAGIRNVRAIRVSSSSPTHIANAISRKRLDRDQRDRGEGEGEDQPGDGDRPRRARAGRPDRRAQVLSLGLAPDATDQEDVVVGAERQQQDRGRDRDEEGQLLIAEQALEDVDREAERRGDGQHADPDQIERRASSCASRIQSRRTSSARAAGATRARALQVSSVEFGRDRGVAGDPRPPLRRGRLRSSMPGRSSSSPESASLASDAVGVAVEDEDVAGGIAVGREHHPGCVSAAAGRRGRPRPETPSASPSRDCRVPSAALRSAIPGPSTTSIVGPRTPGPKLAAAAS